MRDGHLRGALSRLATARQLDVLAAYVAAGGSVQDAAELVGIRPSTVKRHLADLRARSGLTTEQLIYAGRASGRLVVPSLEPMKGPTIAGRSSISIEETTLVPSGPASSAKRDANDRNGRPSIVDATTFGGSHSVTRAVSLVLNPRITLRSMRVEPTPIGPGEAWQICQQALAPAAGARSDLNEVVKPGRGWAYDPDLGRRSRGGGTDMLTDTVPTVVALWRYPVKSMMGEQLNAAEVTDRGLLGDRAYAIVDRETGKVASAKFPRKWPTLLAHRATYVEPPTGTDDLPAVRITLPDGRIIRSDDPDVDQVLSADLGRDVALDRSAPEAPSLEEYWPDMEGLDHRDALTDEAMPPGTFFDVGIVHLVTTATLDRLRQLYPEGRFEVRRFRPNVVVGPTDGEAGFIENAWVGRTLAIGDEVRLRIAKPCQRCVMTTIAQDDLPKDPGILRTAARHNDVNVGVYASVERPGRILRGDEVRLVPG